MSGGEIYKTGEMAKKLGVSLRTLYRWEACGKLVPARRASGQRYYTYEQYLSALGKANTEGGKNIIYCRVSSRGQKDDLSGQVKFTESWCAEHGLRVDRVMTDIGGGLSYKRKNWNSLLKMVMAGEVARIIISYPDRFIRFGFDWFRRLCEENGAEIVVINERKTSPDSELVQDIISILHVFSCRLYGLRKYKTKIKQDRELNGE